MALSSCQHPFPPLHLFGDHSLTITKLLEVPCSVGVEHLNLAYFNLCVAMLFCKSEAISVLNVECQQIKRK